MRHLLLVGSALILAAAGLMAGCYETDIPLGTPEDSKVDRALVGDWTFPASGDAKAATLVIRNIDDKRYYAEWSQEDKTSRGVAIVVPIKDAQFGQFRELTDDGSIAEKHTIMRIEMKDSKLGIRQLSEGFFKDKTIKDTGELKALLEKNLENSAMYDGDFMYGTKKAQ